MSRKALEIMFLMMFVSSGCSQDGWKEDSCQILMPAVASESTEQTEPAKTCHWLDGFRYLEPPASWPIGLDQEKSQSMASNSKKSEKESEILEQKTELGKCIDINQADESQLTMLPGVGQNRARQIIQARGKKPFKRKSDITRIKGIGRKSFRKMAAYICEI